MIKQFLSESYRNRLQELAGIVNENAHKIMNVGFSEDIANYLAKLDKKRGIFFADALTRKFVEDNNLGTGNENIKQILPTINQDELFSFIKNNEEDIKLISDWIKSKQGQVNIKDYGGFDEILTIASEEMDSAQGDEEIVEPNFDENVSYFLRHIDYDIANQLGIIALKGFVKNALKGTGENIEGKNVNELLPLIDQKDFLYFLKRNENELFTIAEWVDSPLRQEQDGETDSHDKNLFLIKKNFKDLEEALAAAHAWHTNLTASGIIRDHSAGRVVERYDDGLYWVDLETNSSKDEAQAMGHCGTDGRATTLYSLRDAKGEPHVTIAYNKDEKNITQVKGKQNKRPVDKYMKYVVDFLSKKVKAGDVASFRWSYPAFGADLKDDEVKDVLKNNKKQYFMYLKKGVQQSMSNLGVRY